MIEESGDLNIEKGLENYSDQSKNESKISEDGHLNQYHNIVKKSFHETPNSSNGYNHSPASKIEKETHSNKEGFGDKTRPDFDITESPINYYSTPKHEANRQQINYHLKRIQQQIEVDRQGWKNQQNDVKNLSNEMKTLKEAMHESKISNAPTETSKSVSSDDMQNLDTYKRKVQKQKATIQLLTEHLEYKEANGKNLKANQLKLFKQKLYKEANRRMKIMKEYTEVKESLNEADRERSELLFALSEVKAEARSILLAYEETSQSLPELKSLLELSAKQKSEFSNQVMRLKNEAEEYKDEIAQLKENIKEHLRIINSTESEKQSLIYQVEETQSKYFDVNTKLTTANQRLLEATQSFNNTEHSKQRLQDNALNTLKSYRSKCRKYEIEIQEYTEHYKIKDVELTKAISQSKELEIENLKQRKLFQELENRMEELQGSIAMYVEKCGQVSDEKNELELTSSHTNSQRREYYTILNEQQQIKDENSIIKVELRNEKQRQLEFESLCYKYRDSNLSMKKENLALQSEIQKERNQLQEERNTNAKVISKLQEQSKNYTEGKQKLHINYEEEKSKALIRKLKSSANENKVIIEQFQMEKEKFDEKVKILEEQKAILQEHVDNRHIAEKASKEKLKVIIGVITEDIDNLLKLLYYGEENISLLKEIPSTDLQIEIVDLREKLQSCFSVTTTLKRGYNQQKVLIKKARERIKSQIEDIHYLKDFQNKESLRYQGEICRLETIQQNNKDRIPKFESQNMDLQKRVNNLTERLREVTRDLHESVEFSKEREMVPNEIEPLNCNQKDKNIWVVTE